MKQAFLALAAVALICAAGYVMAQTPDATVEASSEADRDTQLRLAKMDTSIVAFRKLDKDNDGRISPLEAADNPRVAAAFTLADKDKDGYLSKEEFQALGTSHPQAADVGASSPSGDKATDPTGDKATDPGGDQPATSPQTTPPQP
jgi:hypothetical protein